MESNPKIKSSHFFALSLCLCWFALFICFPLTFLESRVYNLHALYCYHSQMPAHRQEINIHCCRWNGRARYTMWCMCLDMAVDFWRQSHSHSLRQFRRWPFANLFFLFSTREHGWLRLGCGAATLRQASSTRTHRAYCWGICGCIATFRIYFGERGSQ